METVLGLGQSNTDSRVLKEALETTLDRVHWGAMHGL